MLTIYVSNYIYVLIGYCFRHSHIIVYQWIHYGYMRIWIVWKEDKLFVNHDM